MYRVFDLKGVGFKVVGIEEVALGFVSYIWCRVYVS